MKELFKRVLKLISYSGEPYREGFVIDENQYDQAAAQKAWDINSDDRGRTQSGEEPEKRRGRTGHTRQARRTKSRLESEEKPGKISAALDRNKKAIEEIYGLFLFLRIWPPFNNGHPFLSVYKP